MGFETGIDGEDMTEMGRTDFKDVLLGIRIHCPPFLGLLVFEIATHEAFNCFNFYGLYF